MDMDDVRRRRYMVTVVYTGDDDDFGAAIGAGIENSGDPVIWDAELIEDVLFCPVVVEGGC